MKKFTSSDFFLSEQHVFALFCLNQKEELDVHTHEFDEIAIVISGSGFHILNDKPHFISQGDFFYINANDIHYYESINDLSLINILIRKDFPAHFIKNKSIEILKNSILTLTLKSKTPVLDSNNLHEIISLSETINAMNDDEFSDGYFMHTESILLKIIMILLHNTKARPLSVIDKTGKQLLIEYVKNNYMNSFNWKDAESECGVNRRTIFRFFNEISGLTPNNFLQQYRIYKAKEFLRTTDYSISEISKMTGFLYTSHLSKVYRKKFEFTPSEERSSFISEHFL
ncbi:MULTISPECIES: helix-turn-helix domain-containing protein [unclassified Raoultella]|uniref:helix-turn-helix domain-containing protein n=1 Tax=unclassified Raoultella TaxID=2627600 RepID=UPI00135BC298|nr:MULTISPECIES: helix-turn-helix domain-containing protein [unclassified Raoultella]